MNYDFDYDFDPGDAYDEDILPTYCHACHQNCTTHSIEIGYGAYVWGRPSMMAASTCCDSDVTDNPDELEEWEEEEEEWEEMEESEYNLNPKPAPVEKILEPTL